MSATASRPTPGSPPARLLTLHRRRSRRHWIYLLYHSRWAGCGRDAVAGAGWRPGRAHLRDTPGLRGSLPLVAPRTQERRDVDR
jgi:hypothetical protein